MKPIQCEFCDTEENVMVLAVVDGRMPLTGVVVIEDNTDRVKILLHNDGCYFKLGDKPMPYHPETVEESGREDGRHWYEVDVEKWTNICFDCL